MSFSRYFLRIFVLSVFFSTIINNYSYAVEMYFNLSDMQSYAKVVDTFSSKCEDEKQIICIKDLHKNIESQEQIYQALENIKNQYKNKFVLIGAEGAYNKLDAGILGEIKDKNVQDCIINDLMAKNDITGVEKYKILNKNIILQGIENKKIYLKNFETLCASLIYRERLEQVFTDMFSSIERGKRILYRGKILTLYKKELEYKNKKISYIQYLRYLNSLAKDINIQINKKYPTIDLYLSSIKLYERVDRHTAYIEGLEFMRVIVRMLDKNEEKKYLMLKKIFMTFCMD